MGCFNRSEFVNGEFPNPVFLHSELVSFSKMKSWLLHQPVCLIPNETSTWNKLMSNLHILFFLASFCTVALITLAAWHYCRSH